MSNKYSRDGHDIFTHDDDYDDYGGDERRSLVLDLFISARSLGRVDRRRSLVNGNGQQSAIARRRAVSVCVLLASKPKKYTMTMKLQEIGFSSSVLATTDAFQSDAVVRLHVAVSLGGKLREECHVAKFWREEIVACEIWRDVSPTTHGIILGSTILVQRFVQSTHNTQQTATTMMADDSTNNADSSSSSNNNNNKRPRLSSTPAQEQEQEHQLSLLKISDLPDESLEVISKFLSFPSRALFAVAMTAPSLLTAAAGDGEEEESSSFPWKTGKLKATNQAILSMRDCDLQKGYFEIDFGEVGDEVSLASSLNDNDIHGVLICIDAVNRLEYLSLACCTKITGTGLKPLQGSTVLKSIALSTTISWRPNDIMPYNLRPEIVIPILTSIIDAPDNCLRTISMPRSFRETKIAIVEEFQTKFAELLEAEGYVCPRCGRPQKPGGRELEDREYCVYKSEGTRCTGYYCERCYIELYDRVLW